MQTSIPPSIPRWPISFWLGIFFLLCAFYTGIKVPEMRKFPFEGGDTKEYLNPILYWVKQGHYWPDYRLPGYGSLFWIFYAPTQNEKVAKYALTCVSFVLVSCTLVLSAAHLYKKTGSPLAVHLVGFVWATAPIAHKWGWLLPNTNVSALLVLTVLALDKRLYFWAGVGLAAMFFSQPITGALLPIIGIYLCFRYGWSPPWTSPLRKALLLTFIPVLFLETGWVIRNFLRYGDFRPLSGTKTLLHEPLYQNPAKLAYLLSQKLGLSSDSRLTYMLWKGEKLDTVRFFRLIPTSYLSPLQIEAIRSFLLRVHASPPAEGICPPALGLEEKFRKALQNIEIPFTVRKGFLIYHALFSDLLYEAGSLSPLDWLPYGLRHPHYFWGSMSFLLFYLSSLLLMVILAIQKGSITKDGTILYFIIGIFIPLLYWAMGILENRYLLVYTPLLGIWSSYSLVRLLQEVGIFKKANLDQNHVISRRESYSL
ncbi:MAG: hypothetical protein N2170_07180 [Bacteroidia bacterium]|nr:hypothetical protein [Bacteroidia bacterium]